MATATLITRIKSDDSTVYFKKEMSWTLQEKLCYDITLNDDSKVITFAHISDMKSISFSGDGTFIVAITAGGNTISFEIDSGIFLFTPTAVFMATVTQIQITEDKQNDVAIQIRMYGESESS